MSWLSVVNLIAFLAVLSYTLYLFVYVLYSRYLFIKVGKEEVGVKQQLGVGINEFVAQVFGHQKFLIDKKSGIMHFFMFYGFIILQFGAIDLIGKGLTGNPYWQRNREDDMCCGAGGGMM